MSKLISALMIFALTITGVLPSYAQAIYTAKNNTNIKSVNIAQPSPALSERIQSLSNTIISESQINNTGYNSSKGQMAKGGIFSLKAVIPAQLRYTHDTPELRLSVVHGLYPSAYSMGAANLAQAITLLSQTDRNNTLTERTLIPILSNPYVHEIAYIEALLALAKLSARNQLRMGGAELKKIIIKDLKFLRGFPSHELVYGAGKAFDAKLRSRIDAALTSMGVILSKPFVNPATMAQFNQKKDYILNKINIGLLALTVASLGRLKLGASPKPAEPVRLNVFKTPAAKININPAAVEGGALRTGKIIEFNPVGKPAYSPSASANVSASAFEGSAALKLTPAEVQPLSVVRTTPQVTMQPRAASAPLKTLNAQGITPFAFPSAFDKDIAVIGEKFKKVERFNKEQLLDKIRRRQTVTEENMSALSFEDRKEVMREARVYGVLKQKEVQAYNDARSINNMADKALSIVAENEEKIKKDYALNREYIEGYYSRRIYPYLDKPSFEPSSKNTVYRGMLLTVDELKELLKKGMTLDKTSWHTGAKGKEAIISSTSSMSEAQSYIFQSPAEERLRQGAIGVVVEFTKTPMEVPFDDQKLNPTKTIFHTYSDIPRDRIVSVSIYGPYGMESISSIKVRIDSGMEHDPQWHNMFSRRGFDR